MPRLSLLWTLTCFFVKAILLLGKETTDYSATGLIKFIEGFFHKHVRLRSDGELATVALAKHLATHRGGPRKKSHHASTLLCRASADFASRTSTCPDLAMFVAVEHSCILPSTSSSDINPNAHCQTGNSNLNCASFFAHIAAFWFLFSTKV